MTILKQYDAYMDYLKEDDSILEEKLYNGNDDGLVQFGESTDDELHDASMKGDLGKVISLIDSGRFINERDDYGRTPLHQACLKREGSKSLVGWLLDNGANPNAVDKMGDTPLHLTTDIEVAILLLKNKADLKLKNKNEETPLKKIIRGATGTTALHDYIYFLKSKGAK